MFIILFKSRFSKFPWPLYLNAWDPISLSRWDFQHQLSHRTSLPASFRRNVWMGEFRKTCDLRAVRGRSRAAFEHSAALANGGWVNTGGAQKSQFFFLAPLSVNYSQGTPFPPYFASDLPRIPSPWIPSQRRGPGRGLKAFMIPSMLLCCSPASKYTLSHSETQSTNKIFWRLNRIKML